MEMTDSDIPLPANALRVAVVYNLKHLNAAGAIDAEAEYDGMTTIDSIQNALRKHGVWTAAIEQSDSFIEQLRLHKIDIVFNIAEGRGGRAREAQTPAMLDMIGIPYTGSDATTLCLALDKALTKRLLGTYHIQAPKSVIFHSAEERPARLSALRYPLIVKPLNEGSSKGISDMSVVVDERELLTLLRDNIDTYHCDMMAEEYIEGREFTVGILGNGESARVFRPMEIAFHAPTQGSFHVYSYRVKQDFRQYVDCVCPAALEPATEHRMLKTARRVFEALGCRDFARVDFRMDQAGNLYFIEVNPLPGLAPSYSDYPMLAEACGIPYDDLVYAILETAARRNGFALPKEAANA